MTSDGSLRLRNFCMMNPAYFKVLEILEKADVNEWEKTGELKKEAGIDTGSKGEGYASWQAFLKLAGERWGCGFVESAYGLEGWKSYHTSYVRAIPEKKSNIRKFLDKVAA